MAKKWIEDGTTHNKAPELPIQQLMSSKLSLWNKTIKQNWEQQWKDGDNTSSTRRLFPQPHVKHAKMLHQHTPKPITAIITQLITGKIALNALLKSCNIEESVQCACGRGHKTPEHVIITCSHFNNLRRETCGGQPPPWKEIFSKKEHARTAAQFMFATKRLGQFAYVPPEAYEEEQ